MSFGAEDNVSCNYNDERRSSIPTPECFPILIEGFGHGSIHDAACQRRVLILRGLPESVPEQEILSLFQNRNGPVLKGIKYAGNSRWYLVFGSEDEAREANFMLNRDIQTICDKPIKACFKHSMPIYHQRQVMEHHLRNNMFFSAPPSQISSPVPSSSSHHTGIEMLHKQDDMAPLHPTIVDAASLYPQFATQFNVIPAFPSSFVPALHISAFQQGNTIFAHQPQCETNSVSMAAPIAVHLNMGNQMQHQFIAPVPERIRTSSVQTAVDQNAESNVAADSLVGEYDDENSAILESKIFTSSKFYQGDETYKPNYVSETLPQNNHYKRNPRQPDDPRHHLLSERRANTLPRNSRPPNSEFRNQRVQKGYSKNQHDVGFSYATALKTGLHPSSIDSNRR